GTAMAAFKPPAPPVAGATPQGGPSSGAAEAKNMGVASRVADYAQKPALHEGRGMVAGHSFNVPARAGVPIRAQISRAGPIRAQAGGSRDRPGECPSRRPGQAAVFSPQCPANDWQKRETESLHPAFSKHVGAKAQGIGPRQSQVVFAMSLM